MSKVAGLLIFLLSSILSFGSSHDCTGSINLKQTVIADQQPVSGHYEIQNHSVKEIQSPQPGIPRPGNHTDKIIKATDVALHGAAISICHYFDVVEILSSYSTNECPDAFSDPPHLTTFFNLLFRVIISPNAP